VRFRKLQEAVDEVQQPLSLIFVSNRLRSKDSGCYKQNGEQSDHSVNRNRRFSALLAETKKLMDMPNKFIVEFIRYILLNLLNLVIHKFNNSTASNADEMIVLMAIEPMFVPPFTVPDIHPLYEIMLIEDIHGAIDSGPGDIHVSFPQRKINLFRL
tara:strand:+ start:273 stop:740 length:468 start_codon:yes stop_codon:yes gene_type:complete